MAYELKTFLDIVNAVREELGIQSADTLSINKIKRHINQIYLNEIVPYDQWKWLRGNIGLVKDPAYRAGTASVEEGSRNVTVTIAPAQSLKGYWFTTANYSERYRIAAHQGGSTSIVLESEYTGATQSAASYSIWTDAVVLPSDCRETFEVTHAFSAEPMTGLGLQKFRQRSQVNQKIEGRPAYYTTSDYKNPDPYAAISGLPAAVSRASDSLVRTLTFASNIEAFFDIGDRVRVSGAGNKAYNGEFVISAVSGSSITLTGTLNLRETTTADTGYVVELKRNTSTDEKYRELLVYPGIFDKKLTLNIDYIKEVPPLDEDTDEPLIPLEDRQVLVYGALMLAWKSIGRNPEESASNAQMYDRKLSKMQGKLDDSTDMPMLRPGRTYLRTKRHARRRRTSNYFDTDLNTSFGGSGGAGGASSITGEAGKLAQFSSADNTLTASDIVADNVLSTTNTKTVTGKTMDANENIFTNFTHGNQVDNPTSGVHGVSGNVVGTTDAQTLTNKTIDADNNTISNLAHGAEVDNPSSGVHGVTGNIVGDSDTQTLTNKTIDADNNSVSNIRNTNVASNAAIAGTKVSPNFGSQNVSTTGGVSGGTVTSTGNIITEGLLALSDGGSEEITISRPSTINNNQNLILPPDLPSVGQAPVVTNVSGADVTLNWGEAGGGGALNYITDADITADFEGNNVTGWNRYANAVAAATPEENAAGTPNVNVTFAATATTPLIGTYSGLLTKDANNRQGEGVRTDWMTIDNAWTNQFLNGSFLVETGGSYAEGDLTIWVEADLGSSTYEIIPTTWRDVGAGKYEHIFTFDTRSVVAYRLILHIATTNASAWTAKIDQVFVGKREGSLGILDREELTLNLASSGSFTAGQISIIRNGKAVSITGLSSFTHSSSANPSTAVGFIPTRFRPAQQVWNTTGAAGINIAFRLAADGTLSFNYRILDTGVETSRTDAVIAGHVLSYNVADANYTPAANIDLAPSTEQFAFNTSTTDANDFGSFGTGPEGGPISNFTASRRKRIRFSSPIQATDNLSIEILIQGQWQALNGLLLSSAGGSLTQPLIVQNTAVYGVGLQRVASSDTDLEVVFAQYAHSNGATYGAAGAAWSTVTANATRWRVRKSPRVNLSALPQRDYYIEGTSTQTSIANTTITDVTGATLTLPAGSYLLEAKLNMGVEYATIPSAAGGAVLFRDTSDVLLKALPAVESRSSFVDLNSVGSTITSQPTESVKINWPGGTIKLSGRIGTSGGTGLNNKFFAWTFKATRLTN